MSSLYVLEINSLSIALFANIFTLEDGLCFVYGSLYCAAFKFKRVPFVYSYFHILEGGQKRSCCNLWQRVSCLCFSKSSIVFGLTMRGKATCPDLTQLVVWNKSPGWTESRPLLSIPYCLLHSVFMTVHIHQASRTWDSSTGDTGPVPSAVETEEGWTLVYIYSPRPCL